jgi:hypothetical protein
VRTDLLRDVISEPHRRRERGNEWGRLASYISAGAKPSQLAALGGEPLNSDRTF